MPIQFFITPQSVYPTPYTDPFDDLDDWEGNGSSVYQASPWASDVLRLGYNQTANWIYALSGDFDIQIDYYERSGISPRQITFAVQELFGTTTFNDAFTMSYKKDGNGYRSRSYISGVEDVTAIVATPLRDGMFRITRVGDLFTSYYWTGSAWTQAKSATLNNLSGEDVQVRVEDDGSISGDYDNFTVNSGSIVERS